jgi:hypothetical protein
MDWGAVVISTLFLVALAALSGFVLGRNHFSWRAILAASTAIAVLAAFVLENQGFAPLVGISMIVACLIINQAAYLIGTIRVSGSRGPPAERLIHKQADNVPSNGR